MNEKEPLGEEEEEKEQTDKILEPLTEVREQNFWGDNVRGHPQELYYSIVVHIYIYVYIYIYIYI